MRALPFYFVLNKFSLNFFQVTTKELDRDLAEFFRLFCRCSSLVPAVEANSCIEILAKPLLTVVTQEKCKVNVNTLFRVLEF